MKYCNSFSLLDKNEKTFNHAKEYFNAIQNKTPIFSVDMLLQKRELEWHLHHCGKKTKDETTKWIEDNASNLRIYINSLKVIALLAHINIKLHSLNNFSWILFCRCVDIWLEEKNVIMNIAETLKMEEI